MTHPLSNDSALAERPIASSWREIRTPRQRQFYALLLEVRDWTEDDLCAALDTVPPAVVERLARGPVGRRWDCGVCDAFGRMPDHIDGPMWKVYAYHEVPKLYMERREQLHYGPLANEIYERTMATYRAAGWDGEAAGANA